MARAVIESSNDEADIGIDLYWLPLGARWLSRVFPIFRYELRRWRDGVIPDINEAVTARGG